MAAARDDFAASRERVERVLEDSLGTGGLTGEALVESVVSALRPPTSSTEPLDADEKSSLDLAMRIFLDRLLLRAKANRASAEGTGVLRLLDVSIELANANAADWNTPFALLEDLFDSQVISESEAIFPHIEERGAALAKLMAGVWGGARARGSAAQASSHSYLPCVT